MIRTDIGSPGMDCGGDQGVPSGLLLLDDAAQNKNNSYQDDKGNHPANNWSNVITEIYAMIMFITVSTMH